MKKNILVFVVDQVTWRALPAYGNTFVHTPNIDRIAKGGIAIDGCYTPYPLCQPARAALWTGRYPHETGVLSNGRKWKEIGISPTMQTLGEVFSKNGYQTMHFGKTHDGGALRGFYCEPENQLASEKTEEAFPENQDTFHDNYTVSAACEYLEKRQEQSPLFMIADIVNPHNICGWIGENQHIHNGVVTGNELPPLPENFEFDDILNRSKGVQYVCCTNNRQSQAAGWTALNFQQYLEAYYHYLEIADRSIGKILDSYESKYGLEDTLIVLLADHGDSMAARGRVTKQVDMYEEVTRVPLIFKGPNIASHDSPVPCLSSLLDLFPTLCEYAEIEPPKDLWGRSLASELKSGQLENREYIALEWHTEWGYTVSPGRMIRTPQYKYVRYLEDNHEELFDLIEDPYEKTNRASHEAYSKVLEQMREIFNRHLDQTKDDFESLQWEADERWRSHAIGYQNHEGIAAPMLGTEY